jgi:hypothetical protein
VSKRRESNNANKPSGSIRDVGQRLYDNAMAQNEKKSRRKLEIE